jgi:hypothetical protein
VTLRQTTSANLPKARNQTPFGRKSKKPGAEIRMNEVNEANARALGPGDAGAACDHVARRYSPGTA